MQAPPEANGDVVLRAEGLTKDFSGFRAVSGVDLTVRRGTVHALIGPNGAGKTTVFNLMTRFVEPTAGRIVFNGRDITRLRPAAVARLGLVRSFQISSIFPRLTVRDNISIALQRPSGLSFFFWRDESCLDSLAARVQTDAETFRLADLLDKPASDLAYGQKRALEIATTLALEPQVVLLDEPMAALAHGEINHIAGLIRQIARDRTVLMVEHNLSVVAELCDFITVLTRGRVLAEGRYAMVARDPRVIEAYMGTESV